MSAMMTMIMMMTMMISIRPPLCRVIAIRPRALERARSTATEIVNKPAASDGFKARGRDADSGT
jgi:hypothetical protein